MAPPHGGSPKGAERVPPAGPMYAQLPQVAVRPDFTRHRNAAPFKRNDQLLAMLPTGVVVVPGSGISDNLAARPGRPAFRCSTSAEAAVGQNPWTKAVES